MYSGYTNFRVFWEIFAFFCQFLAVLSNCYKGLVEGSNDNTGPWLDALGVELTSGDPDDSAVIGVNPCNGQSISY
jgi:hypothetical protein